MDKYVGETGKNIEKVFAEAAWDSVLVQRKPSSNKSEACIYKIQLQCGTAVGCSEVKREAAQARAMEAILVFDEAPLEFFRCAGLCFWYSRKWRSSEYQELSKLHFCGFPRQLVPLSQHGKSQQVSTKNHSCRAKGLEPSGIGPVIRRVNTGAHSSMTGHASPSKLYQCCAMVEPCLYSDGFEASLQAT